MKAIPKYRHHRASGLGCVTLYGRDIYLGKYGTPESHSDYLAKIAEWQANGGVEPVDDATISDLAERYLGHAERYYRKRGRVTRTFGVAKVVCGVVVAMYPDLPTGRFGITQYKAIRNRWAVGTGEKRGVCRRTVNQYGDRLREVFRWGVEEGLVPVTVLQAIKSVKPLEKGRSIASEPEKIKPVPIAHVEAIRPFVHERVWAKIQLQLLTGMRPGEACSVRTCDIDRSGPVWIYTPYEHKTEHHGKKRPIAIGPKAQAILTPFLDDADPDRLILVRAHASRRIYEGLPAPGGVVRSYGESIDAAAEKAGVPTWNPNQLRHNAGTEVRKRFGIEAAQLMLGHSSANTTEIYAEKNLDAVSRIAAEVG